MEFEVLHYPRGPKLTMRQSLQVTGCILNGREKAGSYFCVGCTYSCQGWVWFIVSSYLR